MYKKRPWKVSRSFWRRQKQIHSWTREKSLWRKEKQNAKYGRVWYKSPAEDVNQKLVENIKIILKCK